MFENSYAIKFYTLFFFFIPFFFLSQRYPNIICLMTVPNRNS